MPEFRAAWRNDKDVLMRKLTGHLAVHEIRDSLDLAHDYGVCHGALASDEAWTDRSEAEDRQLDIEEAGIAPTQVEFLVTNWSAKPYTTKQRIVWPCPQCLGTGTPSSGVDDTSRCCTGARAHWPQLEPATPAGAPAPCCSPRRSR